ncbi:heterokaryon incompatibility protein-domain-containing protein, partial [Dendryphion nanum]
MEADSRQLDQQDYECISRWLADCHENHVSTCPPHTAQRSIQLSFIDCHNAVVVLTPFDASYLALSYVWDVPTHLGVGNTSHQTLLNAPMVIKDAMEVTIRLGYQYLWVDRYCINQDDAEEKYRQINHMNYIYAGAEVTIVAAADMSIVGGLQGVSSRTNSLDSGFRLGPYLHTLVPVPRLAIKRSKWNSRGWTYQEAVLSPRKLVFTTHHIYMQCNGKHAFVSHSPNGQKYTFPPHDNFTGQFKNHQVAMMALESNPYPESHFGRTNVELFNSHIKEYVVRELSFESDRFNAIRGVLSHFETQHPPVFQIYGLPYLT